MSPSISCTPVLAFLLKETETMCVAYNFDAYGLMHGSTECDPVGPSKTTADITTVALFMGLLYQSLGLKRRVLG